MKISLEEHIKQSIIAVNANNIKGNRHGQILAMLYSDPYHFIEEIIQNAEDACRRNANFEHQGQIKIIITEQGINIFHNGSPFTENDLMAITTFASTSKNEELTKNMIGKFGIGFRAVYGITDLPEIHSGKFNYQICNYEILQQIKPKELGTFTTLICLPYKKNLSREIIKQVETKLLNIDNKQILFLTHIAKIEIQAKDETIIISRQSKTIQNGITEEFIETDNKRTTNKHRYILFRQNTHTLKELAIAFERDLNTGDFVNINNAKAFVYFPTQLELSDKFIIHGRFTTNPTRENIIFDQEFCPENILLLNEFEKLLSKTLQWFKKTKLLTEKFFALFDWTQNNTKPIQSSIQKTINNFIATENCLLSNSNKYLNVKDLCIAEHELFTEIINKEQIERIFSRKDYISQKLISNINFANYLRQKHHIKIADIDSFAFHIKSNHNFLANKNIKFFTTFYKILEDNPQLWNIKNKDRYYSLRYSPIILDNKKELSTAFYKNGQASIFIGNAGKTSSVNSKLCENADCLNFFKMLGIPEIDKKIISAEKIIHTLQEKNACTNLFKLYELFETGSDIVKNRILMLLEENCSIPAINKKEESKKIKYPKETYISEEKLEKYFENESSWIIDKKIYQYFQRKGINKNDVNTFFENAGCNKFPKKIAVNSNLTTDEKKKMQSEFEMPQIVKEKIDDYTLDGLENNLKKITFDKSVNLWNLLSEIPEEYKNASYTFESYTRIETEYFQPSFIKTLKNEAWLFDKNKQKQSVKDLTANNLSQNYNLNNEWLCKSLELEQISEISKEEEELLKLFREKKINISALKSKIQKEENIEFKYFESHRQNTIQADNPFTADPKIIKTISSTLLFGGTTDESNIFEKENFEDCTLTIYNGLNKKGENVKIVDNGIIEKNDMKIFVGKFDYTSSSVLLNKKIEQEYKDLKSNFEIYILKEKDCIIVKKEDLKKFREQYKIVCINKIQFD